MEKWFIKNKKQDFRQLAKEAGISEIVARLLINRDIYKKRDVDLFLNPELSYLSNPEDMRDMVKAADILYKKIDENKKIRIVGDFDVDGVMSVFILYKGLKKLGANVDYVIPDRIMDGYGINMDIVRAAKYDGVDTILTCDNGIAAIEQINLAKSIGLTVIVTDHHDIPYTDDGLKVYLKSNADAIINPKQQDCNYPEKTLCGAGISYILVRYLFSRSKDDYEVDEFLQYAAIATICDVVDLVGENRIIVKKGLEILNRTKNIGLNALIDMCGIKDKEIGVYHVGFIIGPTINASGRLDSALYALKLLLCEDVVQAYDIAKNLRDLNEARKSLTNSGVDMVINQIEKDGMNYNKVIVVYEPEIHESIAGIIAGRVKDKYNKPTIVLTRGNEGVKGSARSIEDYNMFEELSKCKDLLNKFGGHPMAAGLSLDENNIEHLRNRLNEYTSLTDEDLIPKVYIDMELPIEYISYKLIEDIRILEPFGKGNVKPLFGGKKLKIYKGYILGVNKNVLKLSLLSFSGQKIEGLLFSDGQGFLMSVEERYGTLQKENMLKGLENSIVVDIIYYPNVNEYNGNSTLQVVIQNYRLN
ncbi:single-stranded-DNA-specific exonuclease RecJ [Tissierella creatinini]|nr:single-stranded-DNA-specific exonuclease RecJ [Tissierella creatinini]TJX69235.1 single-stranded-DNA-specific exonuclease RecJ [Soehngenia saccharolytica]